MKRHWRLWVGIPVAMPLIGLAFLMLLISVGQRPIYCGGAILSLLLFGALLAIVTGLSVVWTLQVEPGEADPAPSSHRYGLRLSVALIALAILTGGFGALPPRIQQLGDCADFLVGRLAPVFFLALIAFTAAIVSWVRKIHGGPAVLCLTGGVLVASAYMNIWLDQDPLGASFNWRRPLLDIDPEWGCGIENHEQVYYDELTGIYYAAGQWPPPPESVRRAHAW